MENIEKNIEKRKKSHTCFLLPLKRAIKKRLTLAACFLRLETPGLPACYPLKRRREERGGRGEQESLTAVTLSWALQHEQESACRELAKPQGTGPS